MSLAVEPGEFVALLGPSGSGKTTMLRLLAGFELPTSGEIVIAGSNVSGLAPSERNIGMVFQHYALFPHMSVARNIEYGLRMRGWDTSRRRARVSELLAMIKLNHVGERLPHQLSGGQQQRVAIARALAYSPSILLMDEPLGALDRALRIEMAEEIRRIHRTLGATFIYVTHDRDEAMTLADRVLVMHQGKIDADGKPQQLFERPQSAFVAEFFSGMNVIRRSSFGRPSAARRSQSANDTLCASIRAARVDARLNNRQPVPWRQMGAALAGWRLNRALARASRRWGRSASNRAGDGGLRTAI